MKILEIIPQLASGGAERFVVDLCNEMSKQGENVILCVLYTIENDWGFFAKDVSKSVHLISLNKKRGIHLRVYKDLWKVIRKEKPDVIHSHVRAIYYTLPFWLLPHKIKYFHTVHNNSPEEAGGKLGLLVRKLAFKLKRVSPISISDKSQESFYNVYHCASTLIYNGRPPFVNDKMRSKKINEELATYRKTSDSIVIVNVARIMKVKNQVSLAKAVDSINQENKAHIELLIIGRFADKDIYTALNNINSTHIHILGEKKEPRYYMAAADAFCLSSIYEGMPITLIEALSVGCIPVCTSAGGVSNVIQDGENGLLTKGISQKDLEDLILRFATLSNEKKKRIKNNTLNSYNKYTIEYCGKRYVELFKDSITYSENN